MQRPAARISHQTRVGIAARLESRRPEIEEAILIRAGAVSDTTLEQDAGYLQGLRGAISAAVGFGLAGIERGEERCGPAPAAVLTQARYASRLRVGLQVVLRRYAAGYSTLSDFLMQELGGEDGEGSPAELYGLQRELTALFDRLLDAVSTEYEDESRRIAPSERHAQRVRRLLAGELIDTAELGYDLDAWHLGAIAAGAGAEQLLRETAVDLDRRLLLVEDDDNETVSAWLGGHREFDQEQLSELAASPGWPRASLAIGEPAYGLGGWRLTHRQACSAAGVAARRPQPFTRYCDIALLASVLRDEDLVVHLLDTYLAPLATERAGGKTLRETLRAYFAAARNISSTAAALGVSRKTVNNRIHAIESRVGRPISACATELETSLCLDQLADPK
jgi:hypothetical protein